MGRVALVMFVGSLASLVLIGSGRASLYSPEDPRFVIPVGMDGKAQPLPLDDFRIALAVLTNAREKKREEDRKAFLERIERAKGKKLSAPESAALASDLLRLGRSDEALNSLAPRLRDRNPDYFVFTTLGHIHAAGGNWRDALRYHTAAQLDSEMPAAVKGLSKSQRDWWDKLDREYVPHYYRLRLKETEERKNKTHAELEKMNEAEDVFPLFPVPDRANPNPQPVRFVNDAGSYQPGVLAAAERAKLPPDAIAIVQQLVLWYPSDNRLYWLLAELYAAEGDLSASFRLFHSSSWGRAYSSRKIMMEHRQAAEAAMIAQPRKTHNDDVALSQPAPPEQPAPEPEKQPISMRTIWIYFAIIGAIALFAFARAMSKRMKGDCGPVG